MLIPNFRDLISEFNAEGVEFLIVGAYALAVHGIPRVTGYVERIVRPNLVHPPVEIVSSVRADFLAYLIPRFLLATPQDTQFGYYRTQYGYSKGWAR